MRHRRPFILGIAILGIIFIPPLLIGEVIYRIPRSRDYEDIPMEQAAVSSEGAELQVWYTNHSTQVVIVFHGHFDNSGILYERSGALLTGKGFDVVYVDFRNHGRSDRARTTLGVDEAKDVVAVTRWAEGNWEDIALLGTSMGAVSVLTSTGSYSSDQVKGIILDSVYLNSGETVDRNLKKDHIPNPWRALVMEYLEIRNWIPQLNLSAYAKSLHVPTLAAIGSDDVVSDIDVLRELDALGNDNITTIEIPAGSHSLLFGIPEYQRSVLEFLNTVFGTTSDHLR